MVLVLAYPAVGEPKLRTFSSPLKASSTASPELPVHSSVRMAIGIVSSILKLSTFISLPPENAPSANVIVFI
jgi:hypothetical protein